MLRLISQDSDPLQPALESKQEEVSVPYRRASPYHLPTELKPILDLLTRKVEKNRDAIDDFIMIGRIYRLMGDPRRAIRLHRNLAARSDVNHDQQILLFTELGFDLQAARSKDFGESYFEKALSLSRNHIPALEGLVWTYEQKGQFEEAFDLLKKLIRLNQPEESHFALLLSEYALYHVKNGKLSRARRAVERALKTDPNCLSAHIVLADVYILAKRYDRATELLRTALGRWPSHSFLTLRRLEDIHFRTDKFPAFEDTLRALIRTSPGNHYLYYSLGRHLQKKHREKEALEFFRRSLEINSLYVNSVRDILDILGTEKAPKELTEHANRFFTLFKRSRRFICPRCLERHREIRWNCASCGFWGWFDIRYELPAP